MRRPDSTVWKMHTSAVGLKETLPKPLKVSLTQVRVQAGAGGSQQAADGAQCQHPELLLCTPADQG